MVERRPAFFAQRVSLLAARAYAPVQALLERVSLVGRFDAGCAVCCPCMAPSARALNSVLSAGGVTHNVCASADVTPRSHWAPCRVPASWCLSSGRLRRCEGGDGLSREGSTRRGRPIRSCRTRVGGDGCSACSAGRVLRGGGSVVVLLSRRVRTDGRPCSRILKDAGRTCTQRRSDRQAGDATGDELGGAVSSVHDEAQQHEGKQRSGRYFDRP